MRKKIRVITIALLLVIPLFCCTGAFLLPMQYGETYMGELKSKQKRLKETKGKRMIFLGGSNLVFGLDSQTIEANFPDYQVVNYGMYAALGTTVLYELSEAALREGDLVILSPEQDSQTLSEYFDPAVMWQGVDGAYDMLLCLDRAKLGQMIGHLPEFAGEKWKYFLKQEKPVPKGVYRKDSFNSYGDLYAKECEKNVMQNGYDSNQRITLSEETADSAFFETTNQWIDRLQQKGVTVWYRFAPMNQRAVEDIKNIDAYYSWLAGMLHCEIVGDPHHSVMDAEWFYDTNFHLNNSGRILYTDQLIRDLKAMLGDSSATEVRKVEKPDLSEMERYQGDDKDADCFASRKAEDGLWLTGLTQEGYKKKELVVPTVIGGEPVVGIDTTVFSEAKNLQAVTIQKNLRLLPDELFEGCSRLETVILDQIAPEELQVGQKLLEGTSGVKLQVEQEYLNQYKTSYSWGGYRASFDAKP